jgi:hypothetical protein
MGLRHASTLSLAATAGVLAFGGTAAFAITGTRQNMDYWFQRLGEDHTAVVKQFGFNTVLTVEEEDNVLTRLEVVYDQQYSGFSSATLVGDGQWLLTAAHTVLPFGLFQYEIGGAIYNAEQWWIPSGYDQDELLYAQDIAVVRLDRRVTNVTPMDWNRDVNFDLRGSGHEFTMVGFGMSDQPEAPTVHPLIGGIRRAARNKFDAEPSGGLLDQHLNLLYDLDVYWDQRQTFNGYDHDRDWPMTFEGMILPGDSGGPDIVDNKIVGVHSYIYTNQDPTGQVLLHGASTDVRRFSSWIRALVDDQDASTGPSAFGYEFGLRGITIEDIREDLDKEIPVLVPWLIGNGFLNPITLMGTSPFGPRFDVITGLSPEEVTPTMLTAEAQAAALQWLYSSKMKDNFRAYTNDTMYAAMVDAFINEFGTMPTPPAELEGEDLAEWELQWASLFDVVANFNHMFNPTMFGTGGMFSKLEFADLILPGDFNRDGEVDGYDLAILLANWHRTHDDFVFEGNLNFDNIVDELDLFLLLDNLTVDLTQTMIDDIYSVTGILVPEPGTGVFLAALALATLRRRRAA